MPRAKNRTTAAMKPEQDNSLRSLTQPMEHSLERLRPPEIVGQMENPVLEAVRRLWWRAFDRVCYGIVLMRLSIHDRIYGPEPTLADLKCEADHERLVRAFPVVDEMIG